MNKKDLFFSLFINFFALLLIFWLIPRHVSPHATALHGLTPQVFPYLVAGLLGVLGFVLTIKIIKKPHKKFDNNIEYKINKDAIFCVLLFGVYMFLIFYVGMLISSLMFLIVFMFFFGSQQWGKVTIISVFMIFILFIFFEKLALVPIPRGYFFEYGF